jgi:hypothetical protein
MATVSDKLLQALSFVESTHRDTCTGDQGKAIGRYQIHESYWKDATSYDKTIGGTYAKCQGNGAYSAQVVRAYMKRYLPAGASDEAIALTHNLGPSGKNQVGKGHAYWTKVKKALDEGS